MAKLLRMNGFNQLRVYKNIFSGLFLG